MRSCDLLDFRKVSPFHLWHIHAQRANDEKWIFQYADRLYKKKGLTDNFGYTISDEEIIKRKLMDSENNKRSDAILTRFQMIAGADLILDHSNRGGTLMVDVGLSRFYIEHDIVRKILSIFFFIGGFLHDIGKFYINNIDCFDPFYLQSLPRKFRGDKEYEMMKRHVSEEYVDWVLVNVFGINPKTVLPHYKDMMMGHHVCEDGSGYGKYSGRDELTIFLLKKFKAIDEAESATSKARDSKTPKKSSEVVNEQHTSVAEGKLESEAVRLTSSVFTDDGGISNTNNITLLPVMKRRIRAYAMHNFLKYDNIVEKLNSRLQSDDRLSITESDILGS